MRNLEPYSVEFIQETSNPNHPIDKLCLVKFSTPILAATYGKSHKRLHHELFFPPSQKNEKEERNSIEEAGLAILDDIASNPQKFGAIRLQKEIKKANNGQGVSSIQTVITYILRGDISRANTVCNIENDKICSYPEFQNKLFDLLPEYYQSLKKITDMFGGEDPKIVNQKKIEGKKTKNQFKGKLNKFSDNSINQPLSN